MSDQSKPHPNEAGLIGRVGAKIRDNGLASADAARQIGVGTDTLRRHLAGEHVRSDSALKYQDWLNGRQGGARSLFRQPGEVKEKSRTTIVADRSLPTAAETGLVVDIFSGCGGLSLGFDLLEGGHFKTILALDHELAPIRVLNSNSTRGAVGRVADLTEFLTGAEFLAFYLDHIARLNNDQSLVSRLGALCEGALLKFRAQIGASDRRLLERLEVARCEEALRRAIARVDRQCFDQTSVAAFHQILKLPKIHAKALNLVETLWSGWSPASEIADAPPPDLVRQARLEWETEVAGLSQKTSGSGRGQLGASGRRVAGFIELVNGPAFTPVREAWIEWRATRKFLRTRTFGDFRLTSGLEDLYQATYPVAVLVGGPPCQGFSRIGRGKIRSLREARVHTHGSSAAGDSRNLLFRQYVMILGALRPQAFVFENVQHFQSTVQADDGDFQASEVLEQAIADISDGRAHYAVTSQVVHAARHGVPQGRVRYFMCGLETAAIGPAKARSFAERCLQLPESREIPLALALEGLGTPAFVGVPSTERGGAPMQFKCAVEGPNTRAGDGFGGWLRQSPPGIRRASKVTDAHVCRFAREDDARFFSLMGPGRRWMDYRAEDAETLHLVRSLVETLLAQPERKLSKGLPSRDQLLDLLGRLDGALPLRLLLEQIQSDLGYPHHLLREVYLSKRDSAHGDWLTRLDPNRPSKTMVSHMAKDTYAFVHPTHARTLSVREAARIQTFPDWFSFGDASLTEGFKMIGNAVPPRLSVAIAAQVAQALAHISHCDKETRVPIVEIAEKDGGKVRTGFVRSSVQG